MVERFFLQPDDGTSSEESSPAVSPLPTRRPSPAIPSSAANINPYATARRPGVSSQHSNDLDLLRRGLLTDATAVLDNEYLPRPPLMERNSGLSGLPRIRHAPAGGPPHRVRTLPNLAMAVQRSSRTQLQQLPEQQIHQPTPIPPPPSHQQLQRQPSSASATASRSASSARPLPHHHASAMAVPTSATATPPTPAAATATTTTSAQLADLHRFPSESLHSFSFAAPPDDLTRTRHATLKRSVDVMRSRLGFDSSSIAEPDLMEDDDSQLHGLFGDRHITRKPMLGGAITGPATVDVDNIFDKAFAEQSSSRMPPSAALPTSPSRLWMAEPAPVLSTIPDGMSVTTSPAPPMSPAKSSPSPSLSPRVPAATPSFPARRSSSTRKGRPALSQAFSVVDLPSAASASFGTETPFAPSGLHTHSSKWAPSSQAVFTTSAQSDWTIRAANDVACLVFGVTQREIRNLSILDLIQTYRRDWLRKKLKGQCARQQQKDDLSDGPRGNDSGIAAVSSTASLPVTSSPRFQAMGRSVTATLLSKPPSRQVRKSPRAVAADKGQSSKSGTGASQQGASQGVLLCGDVLPIQRRNGATGSASVWVKMKQNGLIWVLEEVLEDAVRLRLDNNGHVVESQGTPDLIWAKNAISAGINLRDLLPRLPTALPSERDALVAKVARLKYFTATTSTGINVPVTVTEMSGPHSLLISHFPYAAGMMIVNAASLEVVGANSVFSGTLFGYDKPEGHKITELIPNFDGYLEILFEEDETLLSDGVLIPEHGLRRAYAIMTIRQGKDDAMALFEKPAGIPARHCDGAEIIVDVSMRVVMPGTVIPNDSETAGSEPTVAKEALYALWVTYHRPLKAAGAAAASRATAAAVAAAAARPRPASPLSHTSQSPRDRLSPRHTPVPGPPSLSPGGLPSRLDTDSPTLLQQQLREAASQPMDDHQPRGPIPDVSLTELTRESARQKSISDYIIIEDMGHGAYGQVKLARLKRNPEKKVVLKYVTKKRILVDTWTRDRRLGTVPLEIHVLDYLRREGLRHPNIVEMEGFFEDDINYYIEMLPHGLPGMDLFDYIELRTNMSESECRDIFTQVVGAIHHLHSKALVVHRDIKDENVILDGEGRIKLIDFGSASYIKNGPFDVFVGTIDYAAPEVLQGKSYNGKEQDIWALGILLYTIVYKENPFYNVDEILDHPLRVPYLPFSEDCIDLIRGMLNRTVEKRLTIEEVMEHPWMTDSEQSDLHPMETQTVKLE